MLVPANSCLMNRMVSYPLNPVILCMYVSCTVEHLFKGNDAGVDADNKLIYVVNDRIVEVNTSIKSRKYY